MGGWGGGGMSNKGENLHFKGCVPVHDQFCMAGYCGCAGGGVVAKVKIYSK